MAAATIAAAAGAGAARATITPAQRIDGPGQAIVDLGGIAMAPDGTGGIVYRRIVGGRPHVFAARFVDRRWTAPVRVDYQSPYAASWPRIAARDGGGLVVVWTQEYGTTDRLLSSVLAPGAVSFLAPIVVDFDIGKATSTYPSLAVSGTTGGLLGYRVITQQQAGVNGLRPGRNRAEFRLARLDNRHWSALGPVNRNPVNDLPPPTSENSPKVALDEAGDGVVAWIESGDDGFDRVWARRVIGSNTGFPLVAGPGEAVRANADAVSVAMGDVGAAAVALRQQGDGPTLSGPRLFVDSLRALDAGPAAAQFDAPRIADGGLAAGAAPATPGAPAIAVTRDGQLQLSYATPSGGVLVSGDATSLGAPAPVALAGTITAGPFATLGRRGANGQAWAVSTDGHAGVAVREQDDNGAVRLATVSGATGGPVDELGLAGTGLGDALVGLRQGDANSSEIDASLLDAPPGAFAVYPPEAPVAPAVATIKWDAPSEAFAGMTYDVYLDGVRRAQGLRGETLRLDPRGLEDGSYEVQVRARDAAGQATLSAPGTLKIDSTPPTARVGVRGHGLVRVALSDDGSSDNVNGDTVAIGWGDGAPSATGDTSFAHRYRKPGRYRLSIRASDTAGNVLRLTRVLDVRR